MKAKRYIFVTNENKEVVRFCGLVKRKVFWPRRELAVPYLFWHHHLVKEVWLPENATAVRAGVFAELTALEDIYIPNHITLFATKSCRHMIGMLIISLVPVLLPSSGMFRTKRHGCT